MRLTFLFCALVVVQPVLWPVPVRAEIYANCSTYVGTLAKDLQTNTTMVDDNARPHSPTPDHVVQSAAGYNKYVYYSEICPSPKKPYVEALLSTWKAWLDHATIHVNPTDMTKLAVEKLERCIAAYHGTDEGATCTSWQQQVAKWQADWGP